MPNYIIQGLCNGVPYWLKINEDDQYDFSWQGLRGNGSVFSTQEIAESWKQLLESKSKLNMEVVNYD